MSNVPGGGGNGGGGKGGGGGGADGRATPAPAPNQDLASGRLRVWDLPTRLFHWVLVALVSVNIYTGWTGGLREMDYHMLSGYSILALVLFRVVWGIVGTRHARFADFVRGPGSVFAYLRGLLREPYRSHLGHNPLGGWSVLAMLASLLVQAVTGLFASDDIFTEGPLHNRVSSATADTLTAIHHVNADVLIALIAIHIAAAVAYLVIKGDNLIVPMITGRKRGDAAATSAGSNPSAMTWREAWAVPVLACAATVVWGVISL